MIATVKAGPYTVRGVSVGGVYTSIHVPELDLLFDVGVALRSAAAVGTLCLSHGHADHIGALTTLLGVRGLVDHKKPLRVIMPAEIVATVVRGLELMSELQRWPLTIEPVGLEPGDHYELKKDLWVRAVRTFHPVPSLGFHVVRRVRKLRAEHAGLPGPEIAARRRAGGDDDLFETTDLSELSYLTDTLIQVVEHSPEVLASRVLVMETTFLDERKSLDTARAGCHVHLDEVIDRASSFVTPHLVLMHVSQIYRPDEVAGILDARLPEPLRARTQALVPEGRVWPG